MKHSLRKGVAGVCTILACMLLLSCSNKPAFKTPEIRKPSVSLNFISNWGGSSPYADLVEETLAGFTKQNPEYEVINDSVSDEDYLNKLKTSFASGYIPDIFCLWPGYELNRLISSGQVANLTDVLSYESGELANRFSKTALEECSLNSRYYGIPFEVAFVALYVNKSLLADYGLEVPKTFEELKKAVGVLRDNKVVPIAYSGHYEGSLLYQAIVAALSDSTANLNAAGDSRVDRSFVEAMRLLKELYKMEAFPEKAFTMNGHEQNKLFLRGKAAMIVQGSWFSGFLEDMDDEIEIINFPSPKGPDSPEKLICNYGYGSLHISSKSFSDPIRHEACIKFLEYFTSEDTAERFVGEKGMISAVNINPEIYGSNPFAKKGLDMIGQSDEICRFPSEFFGDSAWTEYFIKRFPYMLEDRMPPEQLYDHALKMMRR